MEDIDKLKIIKKWLGSGSINIFGKPFAGKDSQSHKLAKMLDGCVLSGGDILRHSVLPTKSKESLKTGELIPSADYVKIVLPFLSRDEFQGKPLILSSVGRWHGEEPGVINALNSSNHNLKIVFYLKISNNEAFSRWEKSKELNDRGGRHDDTAEILSVRLQEFDTKTVPVVEFYQQKGLLLEIDGNQSREKVLEEIIDKLYKASLASA